MTPLPYFRPLLFTVVSRKNHHPDASVLLPLSRLYHALLLMACLALRFPPVYPPSLPLVFSPLFGWVFVAIRVFRSYALFLQALYCFLIYLSILLASSLPYPIRLSSSFIRPSYSILSLLVIFSFYIPYLLRSHWATGHARRSRSPSWPSSLHSSSLPLYLFIIFLISCG